MLGDDAIARREQRAWTRAAKIHAPAIAMPRANWETVLDRWNTWNVCTGGRPGKLLDRSSVVGPALEQVPRKLDVVCKDALGLNGLLVGQLEQRSLATRGSSQHNMVYSVT